MRGSSENWRRRGLGFDACRRGRPSSIHEKLGTRRFCESRIHHSAMRGVGSVSTAPSGLGWCGGFHPGFRRSGSTLGCIPAASRLKGVRGATVNRVGYNAGVDSTSLPLSTTLIECPNRIRKVPALRRRRSWSMRLEPAERSREHPSDPRRRYQGRRHRFQLERRMDALGFRQAVLDLDGPTAIILPPATRDASRPAWGSGSCAPKRGCFGGSCALWVCIPAPSKLVTRLCKPSTSGVTALEEEYAADKADFEKRFRDLERRAGIERREGDGD